MSGFQKSVKTTPALAVAGDYASANPRASVVAPEAGFVAGDNGAVVGLFAWVDGVQVDNTAQSGAPDGLIHREQQALITGYLDESSNTIPAGFPVTIMKMGDFFMKATVGGATRGQKAFAKLSDGTMQAGAAGATISGYVETPFVIQRTCLVNELTVVSPAA